MKASLAEDAGDLEAVGGKTDRKRIVEKSQILAGNPRPAGAEKLAGYSDRYRIRQGNFRVIYLIGDARHEVTIYRIGHRKDVYR